MREYKRNWAREARKAKAPSIAVLDTETIPFDEENEIEIIPFVFELWDGANSVVVWEEDYEKFTDKLIAALSALPNDRRWIVYAHNGGKFDFMFLVNRLRGTVSFKGRGIMSAFIAPHVELRDSMHIIPDALKSYKKDEFDYDKMRPEKRRNHRKEILEYLHSDCVYLYDLVTHFIDKHGPKISIGQAAWHTLKRQYQIENFGEASDSYIREWYFGGRVECLQGPGLFKGDYVLEDVNSMYPDRMAHCEHPIGCEFSIRSKGHPKINSRTVFLEVDCENFGALVGRDEEGKLSCNIPHGRFKTTIWEYETAIELGLIRNVRIVSCIDFFKRSNFMDWVKPRYDQRQSIKDQIDAFFGGNISELERESLILKLEMNNAYGKGAQNPRNFREFEYTDCKERPPGEHVGLNRYRDADGKDWTLHLESENEFLVWEKPISQLRFNNVAMAASITGAARAKLLRRIATAIDPIYCDTDSVICRRTTAKTSNALGDWKVEKPISEALIGGRKLYAYRGDFKGGEVVRSKGGRGLKWDDLSSIINGKSVIKRNLAPTFDKVGFQSYTSRTFSLTCPVDYQSRIFAR